MSELARENGYVELVENLPSPLTSAEISHLLKKSPGWFARDVVRKRFYAQGFPHPFERGLWSAKAVAEWLAAAGSNPHGVQPGERKKPASRRPRPNGYAPVAEAR